MGNECCTIDENFQQVQEQRKLTPNNPKRTNTLLTEYRASFSKRQSISMRRKLSANRGEMKQEEGLQQSPRFSTISQIDTNQNTLQIKRVTQDNGNASKSFFETKSHSKQSLYDENQFCDDKQTKLQRLLQIRENIEKKETDDIHQEFKKKVSLMKLDAIIKEVKETGNAVFSEQANRFIKITHHLDQYRQTMPLHRTQFTEFSIKPVIPKLNLQILHDRNNIIKSNENENEEENQISDDELKVCDSKCEKPQEEVKQDVKFINFKGYIEKSSRSDCNINNNMKLNLNLLKERLTVLAKQSHFESKKSIKKYVVAPSHSPANSSEFRKIQEIVAWDMKSTQIRESVKTIDVLMALQLNSERDQIQSKSVSDDDQSELIFHNYESMPSFEQHNLLIQDNKLSSNDSDYE